MKSLQVVNRDGDLELVEPDVPEIGVNDVLVEVEATSVGLTVYKAIHGRIADDPANRPRIPGHEIVGRVVEVGDGVTEVDRGDRVGAYFYLSCGRCDACRSGHEPLCENLDGHVGVDIDGGFAEYARLPAFNAITLPDALDPIDATVVPDAVATPYHVADRRAEVEPGDEVMILGAGGGVGIHLVQMVQYFGGRVTAVDQRAYKLDRCADLGAIRTVDTTAESLVDLDVSFDAVVDFTSSPDLVMQALDLVAPQGTVVILSGSFDRPIEIESRGLVHREFDVVGSRYCSRYEFRRGASLVADGTIEPVVTEVVDLDGVTDLLDAIAAGDHLGRGAVTP